MNLRKFSKINMESDLYPFISNVLGQRENKNSLPLTLNRVNRPATVTSESRQEKPMFSHRAGLLCSSSSPFSLLSGLQAEPPAAMTLPEYQSTPKTASQGNQANHNFVRHNSCPARRINFTSNYETVGSSSNNGSYTPVLDFTKLKETMTTTPDSGFCTPALGAFESISSPPYCSPIKAAPGSNPQSYRAGMFAATPLGVPKESMKRRVPSSSHSQLERLSMSESQPLPEAFGLNRSLDLPSWLNTFCHSQVNNTSSNSNTNQLPTNLLTQTGSSANQLSLPGFKKTLGGPSGPQAALPGAVSLTPLPVIMAPAMPRLMTDTASLVSKGAGIKKRKVLEELPANAAATSQSGNERPNHSYMDLIKMALESAPEGQMTLKEITAWIEDHFSYFRLIAKQTWKNSIRHNLSLHRDFTKVEEKRHGGKWKLAADAKKYAHRIPKPPVIKPPPKAEPVRFVKKRRSGPQLILPKTMPYALVPIALAPFGQEATPSNNQTSELQQPSHTQYSQQIQLQMQPLSNQHFQQTQQQQQLQVQYPPLIREKLPKEQQQKCPTAQPPSHDMEKPREVKLHIRLTQEQQQLLHLEQTQKNSHAILSQSPLPEPQDRNLLGNLDKVNDGGASSQLFDLPYKSHGFSQGQFVPRRQNKHAQDKTMKLRLLVPKPTSNMDDLPYKFADFLKKRKNKLGNAVPEKSQICSVISKNENEPSESKPKQPKMKQGSNKDRNICRILDRLHRSKSFDAPSRVKKTKDLTKLRPVCRTSKVAPVMNLASMVREDQQAAEEINRILQQDETRCDLELGNKEHELVENMKINKLAHCQAVNKRRDLNRPESEPGKSLIQQAWDQAMSPIVWDEDSCSSYISSGYDDTAAMSSSYADRTLFVSKVSKGYDKIKSCDSLKNEYLNQIMTSVDTKDSNYKFNNISLVFNHSKEKRMVSEVEIVSSSSPGPCPETVLMKTPYYTKDCDMKLSDSLPSSCERSKKTRDETSLSEEPHIRENLIPEDPGKDKPRFYRTKSRRKQVHVPLTMDLSPKRDDMPGSQSTGQKSQEEMVGETSRSKHGVRAEACEQHLVGENIEGSRFSEERLNRQHNKHETLTVSERVDCQTISAKQCHASENEVSKVSKCLKNVTSMNQASNSDSVCATYPHFLYQSLKVRSSEGDSETNTIATKLLNADSSSRDKPPRAEDVNIEIKPRSDTLAHFMALTQTPPPGSNISHHLRQDAPPENSSLAFSCRDISAFYTSPNQNRLNVTGHSLSTAYPCSPLQQPNESYPQNVGASNPSTLFNAGVFQQHGGQNRQVCGGNSPSRTHSITSLLHPSQLNPKTAGNKSPTSQPIAAYHQQVEPNHQGSDKNGPTFTTFNHEREANHQNSISVSPSSFSMRAFHQHNSVIPAAGVSPTVSTEDLDANDSSFLNCSVFDNIDSLMQTSLTEPSSPFSELP